MFSLGTEQEFSYHFRIPIEAGQHSDSSDEDVKYMKRRIFALNKRLQTVIHRQGFDVLRSFLPPKFEYGQLIFRSIGIFILFYSLAIKIKCRPLQRILYETYIQYQNIDAVNNNLSKYLII